MTLLYLALITYGLCFLAADARIFGADATAFREVHDNGSAPNDVAWLWSVGILPIRPFFMKVRFIREHLSCYFCMGVWAGPLAHYLLMTLTSFGPPWQMSDYFLNHPDTGVGWTYGFICAFLFGAVSSYTINLCLQVLEARIDG
jgi:hypothetical protein